MLPWVRPITIEEDEATILSKLFSKPLLHNEFQMKAVESQSGKTPKPPLLQYEIAHHSIYEPDDVESDDTRLLAEELSYAGYHPNFNMNPDFYAYDMHPGNYIRPPPKPVIMPSVWECVKNAFTLPSR